MNTIQPADQPNKSLDTATPRPLNHAMGPLPDDSRAQLSAEISLAIDGELDDVAFEKMLQSFSTSEAQADWQLYHLIGDVMRSPDLAQVGRPDLAKRVMAALEHEPIVFAPAALPKQPVVARRWLRRYTMPSAAALAAVSMVSWMAWNQSQPTQPLAQVSLNTTTPIAQVNQTIADQIKLASAATIPSSTSARAVDPQQAQSYVQYMQAHQQFSPAGHLQGSAQFVRGANPAIVLVSETE